MTTGQKKGIPTMIRTSTPTRTERLLLIAAVRGALSGTARAMISWLLDH
jgi:DNA-binding FrmR family transcriptional regulator